MPTLQQGVRGVTEREVLARMVDTMTDAIDGPRAFLTPRQAVRCWCQISGLVYHGLGDYAEPVDCMCDLANGSRRDSGRALRFVLWAVVASLDAHGVALPREIDLAFLLRAVQL